MTPPIRTCLGCRARRPTTAMLRLVRGAGGVVVVDRRRTAGGRGAYVCEDPGCLERAVRGGRLAHAFRAPSDPGPELRGGAGAPATEPVERRRRERRARTAAGASA